MKMTDEHGRVHKQRYELDIVIADGRIMLVEMKGHSDMDDIERFLECVGQYLHLEQPSQTVEKILVTFDVSGPAQDRAEAEGITIIMPDE